MSIRTVIGIIYLFYMFCIYTISRWKGVECFTWRTIFKRHKLDKEWEDVVGLTNIKYLLHYMNSILISSIIFGPLAVKCKIWNSKTHLKTLSVTIVKLKSNCLWIADFSFIKYINVFFNDGSQCLWVRSIHYFQMTFTCKC